MSGVLDVVELGHWEQQPGFQVLLLDELKILLVPREAHLGLLGVLLRRSGWVLINEDVFLPFGSPSFAFSYS